MRDIPSAKARKVPTLSPAEVLAGILKNPTDIDIVRSLTSPDVTYVSLNHENAELKRVMPWAGTSKGAESIVKTFLDVARYWRIEAFETEALFGSAEFAAALGRFTYKSAVLGKSVTSLFAVFAKVAGGRCTYLQFMEDTFATAASFRSGGSWTFRSNPDGDEVVI